MAGPSGDVPVGASADRPPELRCRACGARLEGVFIDLGVSPPCEDFLTADRIHEPETFYPLDVRVCDVCRLVQLPPYLAPDAIFRDYHYFSSVSSSWVAHAGRLVAEAVRRQGLGPTSRVVEIASNDGYLLRQVIDLGIPAVGVEPARNIATVARERGVPTIDEFFGLDLARTMVARDGRADWIVANNVFAHIPELNDFTAGFAELLAADGLLSIEVAYLPRLIDHNEFDTIYHEHFMYYTLLSAERVLARHGLRVYDVEELPTHGGSIRLWVVHDDDGRATTAAVDDLRAREREAGFDGPEGYGGFASRVEVVRRDLLAFLIEERRRGSRIAGYGAPGKANTLLNYCGIRTDLIAYLVDRNVDKQGRYTPGMRIPIHAPEVLDADRPDVIVIMAWNLRDEISAQLAHTAAWGARLVVAIPALSMLGPGGWVAP